MAKNEKNNDPTVEENREAMNLLLEIAGLAEESRSLSDQLVISGQRGPAVRLSNTFNQEAIGTLKRFNSELRKLLNPSTN
jgi:hypothetical protein